MRNGEEGGWGWKGSGGEVARVWCSNSSHFARGRYKGVLHERRTERKARTRDTEVGGG